MDEKREPNAPNTESSAPGAKRTLKEVYRDTLAISYESDILKALFVSTIIPLVYSLGSKSPVHFSHKDADWSQLGGMVAMGLPKAIRRIANMLRPLFLNRLVLALGGGAAMSAMSVRNNLSDIGDDTWSAGECPNCGGEFAFTNSDAGPHERKCNTRVINGCLNTCVINGCLLGNLSSACCLIVTLAGASGIRHNLQCDYATTKRVMLTFFRMS